MSTILDNLRSAWVVLNERVNIALRTRLGDIQHLHHHLHDTAQFVQSIEQVLKTILLLEDSRQNSNHVSTAAI